ncbi:hypothetical protein B0J11DRAFT_586048 [Dendryphion nanum]|uniref:Uncharacterized protein n=1 Tax=Dendryphion nanum TaxID=256645 RepID=A0A9P9D1E0_9PLEO|nr:hypothetical protein B0J11DRAFT_586048 [Dendryphion nanum]
MLINKLLSLGLLGLVAASPVKQEVASSQNHSPGWVLGKDSAEELVEGGVCTDFGVTVEAYGIHIGHWCTFFYEVACEGSETYDVHETTGRIFKDRVLSYMCWSDEDKVRRASDEDRVLDIVPSGLVKRDQVPKDIVGAGTDRLGNSIYLMSGNCSQLPNSAKNFTVNMEHECYFYGDSACTQQLLVTSKMRTGDFKTADSATLWAYTCVPVLTAFTATITAGPLTGYYITKDGMIYSLETGMCKKMPFHAKDAAIGLGYTCNFYKEPNCQAATPESPMHSIDGPNRVTFTKGAPGRYECTSHWGKPWMAK